MKKVICLSLALIILLSFATFTAFATDYTSFDIIFEEKDGEIVNETELKIFASVDGGELVDRTDEFTLEDVNWTKYVSEPEEGKTADDYDYVDEELKIYGTLCTDEDVFDHENFSYFLRIPRLYANEEDSFDRNIKINGVDIEELNGICYNTGSEFFIKTVTNGSTGSNIIEEPEIEENESPIVSAENTEINEEISENKCKVCGICPIQPLGICLFIWIAIILVIIILVILLIVKGKKKNKKEN